MAWLGIYFGISNNCDVWFYRVGQSRETGKEHDDDSVEEGFQLARVKFDRDGGGGREILGVGCCSINI